MEDKIEVIFTQLPFQPNKGILFWIKHTHSSLSPVPTILLSGFYMCIILPMSDILSLTPLPSLKKFYNTGSVKAGLSAAPTKVAWVFSIHILSCIPTFNETFLNASDVRIPFFQLPSHTSLLQAGC